MTDDCGFLIEKYNFLNKSYDYLEKRPLLQI